MKKYSKSEISMLNKNKEVLMMDREELLEVIQRHKNPAYKVIASELGCTYEGLRYALQKHDLTHAVYPDRTSAVCSMILDAEKLTYSVADITRGTGVSAHLIRSIAANNGLDGYLRNGNDVISPSVIAAIRSEIESGKNYKEVCAEFGISSTYYWMVTKNADLSSVTHNFTKLRCAFMSLRLGMSTLEISNTLQVKYYDVMSAIREYKKSVKSNDGKTITKEEAIESETYAMVTNLSTGIKKFLTVKEYESMMKDKYNPDLKFEILKKINWVEE